MTKYGPIEGPCGWERHATTLELETLHQILNCAAGRGCALCVKCSEQALEKLLHIARKEKTFGFLALERLETEMELGGVLGL